MKDLLKTVDTEGFRFGKKLRAVLAGALQAACFGTVEMPPEIDPNPSPIKIYHEYISCEGKTVIYPVHQIAIKRMRQRTFSPSLPPIA